MAPHATTRVFALIGDPVAHSRSPAMHNAAFAARAVDAVYVALRSGEDDAPHLVRALARAGGGGNVTVPHKQAVLSALDTRSDAVRRTGACNTFWGEQGKVVGDNTDIAGVRSAVQQLIGDPAGARVLLLGAGGAARAAAAALLDDGVERIDVFNRTQAAATRLVALLADPRLRATRQTEAADLLVNATPLGLHADDTLPVEQESLPGFRAVLDLVYCTPTTPLVRAALAAGTPAIDGTHMLLAQGAASFRLWTGLEPPLDAMRAALSPGTT